MSELKSISYEEARAEHFRALMKKELRKSDWWQARENKLRPLDMASRSHIECSEAGARYSYYNDALEALEKQPKWISVDEQHPDAGEWVLTYCSGYAKWFELNKWCGNCWLKTMPVTHWMPLPEAPKEDA